MFFRRKAICILRDQLYLMPAVKTTMPFLELRRLLFDLTDQNSNVCIRFRFIGEMWQMNHMRVLKITDNEVALTDELANKLIFLKNLKNVVQFEIDQPFRQYQPHCHYTVEPALEY